MISSQELKMALWSEALDDAMTSYTQAVKNFNDSLEIYCSALNKFFGTADEKPAKTNHTVPDITFENILNGVESL